MTARLFADSPWSTFPIEIDAVPPVIPISGLTSNATWGAEITSSSRTIANLRWSPILDARTLVNSVNLSADSSLKFNCTTHSFWGYTAKASSISLPVNSAGPSSYMIGNPSLNDNK